MPTKVIVLGEKPVEAKKKPIEFRKSLNTDLEFTICINSFSPREYKNIELICLGYNTHVPTDRDDNVDLIFAYNDDRRKGILFLGKFNDGVVE
jgi:hypothetical protein